jgi:hypothetical protein
MFNRTARNIIKDMGFLKKFFLPFLIVAFLLELIFFIPWALQNNVFRDFFFPEVFNTSTFKQNIKIVNNALEVQLKKIPEELAIELASTRLYFMLSTKEIVSVQSFVFENGAFSAAEIDDQEDLFYSYSSDGSKAVFFALPQERRTIPKDWGAQAGLYGADTRGENAAFPEIVNASLLDATNVQYKQHPDVSNTGEVLFLGWNGGYMPTVENANDWSIYKVVDRKAEFLTSGFMPKWVNDTEFVYLKHDGLYLSDAAMMSPRRIATSSEAVVRSNNRFDISDDGKLLVWTQPELSQALIYEIQDDKSLILKATLPVKAFWTLFSPSSNYLALETIAPTATGREDMPQAKVEFYDMRSFEKVPELEIDFDIFDQKNMYMTDWVLK